MIECAEASVGAHLTRLCLAAVSVSPPFPCDLCEQARHAYGVSGALQCFTSVSAPSRLLRTVAAREALAQFMASGKDAVCRQRGSLVVHGCSRRRAIRWLCPPSGGRSGSSLGFQARWQIDKGIGASMHYDCVIRNTIYGYRGDFRREAGARRWRARRIHALEYPANRGVALGCPSPAPYSLGDGEDSRGRLNRRGRPRSCAPRA